MAKAGTRTKPPLANDEDTERLSIKLPRSAKLALELVATEDKRRMSELVRDAIAMYLASRGVKEP